MKKIILMFSTLCLFTLSVVAQTPQASTDPVEKKQKGKDKMTARHHHEGMKSLGLNAEQKQKMKEIRTQNQGKLKAIKSDASLTKEQKRTQAHAIMTEQDNAVKNILTAEQNAKWGDMKKQRKAHGSKMKQHAKREHKNAEPKQGGNKE